MRYCVHELTPAEDKQMSRYAGMDAKTYEFLSEGHEFESIRLHEDCQPDFLEANPTVTLEFLEDGDTSDDTCQHCEEPMIDED
jgi:hypothetical protein